MAAWTVEYWAEMMAALRADHSAANLAASSVDCWVVLWVVPLAAYWVAPLVVYSADKLVVH